MTVVNGHYWNVLEIGRKLTFERPECRFFEAYSQKVQAFGTLRRKLNLSCFIQRSFEVVDDLAAMWPRKVVIELAYNGPLFAHCQTGIGIQIDHILWQVARR